MFDWILLLEIFIKLAQKCIMLGHLDIKTVKKL